MATHFATSSLTPIAARQVLEILDEEFLRYLDITRLLMKQLKRTHDREICSKYVRRCCAMNGPSLSVKKCRNEFFKYFLQMLNTAAENQPDDLDETKVGTASFWV